MHQRSHIIRSTVAPLVPFLAVAALIGGRWAVPAAADDGSYGQSRAQQARVEDGSARARPPGTGPGAVLDPSPGQGRGQGQGQDAGQGPGPSGVRGDPRRDGARIFTGEAFDTCIAPPASTMRAWRESPYGAIGVYIGGRGRGCPQQPNLNAAWTRQVRDMGWQLLPVYVGSQAPCVSSVHKRKFAMTPGRAAGQGADEGRDAVARAGALGMGPHSALYLDMEAYNHNMAECAAATLDFVQSWDRAVRGAGYLPGLYSSAGSGIAHMERARKAGRADLPQALWFAHWQRPPSVQDEPAIDRFAWQPHRRIHQYQGNVQRSYGGRRLTIDRNVVDAPVAIVP